MNKLHALPIALSLLLCGCTSEDVDLGESPGVEVNTNRPPDLNPRTDGDVDVTPPDVDVDVHRQPGQLPDVDVDVTKPRDSDTNANETEAPGVDR